MADVGFHSLSSSLAHLVTLILTFPHFFFLSWFLYSFDEVLQLKGEHFSIGKPSLEEPQWFYSVNVVVPFRRSDPSEGTIMYDMRFQSDDCVHFF